MPEAAAVERELTEPVDLCDARGRLDSSARGWSPLPLHRANLRGPWGRRKRWEYWCVTAPDLIVSITYADVDYVGIAGLWILRPSDGLVVDVGQVVPLARGFHLPDEPCTGTMAFSSRGLAVGIEERPDATRLTASAPGSPHGPVEVDLVIERPAGHETMNVVIPWSGRRFQYTSKQNTRPTRGEVQVGDEVITVGAEPGDPAEAFGTLDLGRGLWPYSIRWNWGSGSGRAADGRLVGLQFGGKWTEGTGHTENALCVDGHLTKIHDELVWEYDWDRPLEPWRVAGAPRGLVEARPEPFHDKQSRTSLRGLSLEVHQVFGHWSGRLRTAAGDEVTFDGVLGWAEEARNRW